MLNGEGKCDGISYTYSYLLNQFGIKTSVLWGKAEGEEMHSWNIVFLDGEPYLTDVTFDLGSSHCYLNLNDEIFSKDHWYYKNIICNSLESNWFFRRGLYFTDGQQIKDYFRTTYN